MADELLIDVGEGEPISLYREKGETDWTGTKWTCEHAVYTRHLGSWKDFYRCMHPDVYEPLVMVECKSSKPNPKCELWEEKEKFIKKEWVESKW